MPGTMAAVKAAATRLNSRYAGSGIHLLSQDATEKIARMAQALAATLHSSDELHQMLYVKPEHVAAVEEMIDDLYKSRDLEYDTYVRQHSEQTDFDYAKAEADLSTKLMHWGAEMDEIYMVFARNSSVSNMMLEAVCGESRTTKLVLKELLKKELIKQASRGGYSATTRLNELLRMWHRRTGM